MNTSLPLRTALNLRYVSVPLATPIPAAGVSVAIPAPPLGRAYSKQIEVVEWYTLALRLEGAGAWSRSPLEAASLAPFTLMIRAAMLFSVIHPAGGAPSASISTLFASMYLVILQAPLFWSFVA